MSEEWIDIRKGLPGGIAGKFQVNRSNGEEQEAYYYQDAMGWAAFYGHPISHWWDANRPNERLDDVTHWKEI
jgi:hypothetical protein